MNVNGYVGKVMTSIASHPRASIASMGGIINAANGEPGAYAKQVSFDQQMSARQGPPGWAKEVEAAKAALSQGTQWKQFRDSLNLPGAMTTDIEKMAQTRQVMEQHLPKTIDLNEREYHAQDQARKSDRSELLTSFAQARARSGKSQVAQQVRNAYTNLTGANIKAVRQAFVKFAG